MSHFYATSLGARGTSKKAGNKISGIETHTRGWHSGIKVSATHVNGVDVFTVYATSGSNATSQDIELGYFQNETFTLKVGVKSPLGRKIKL